MSIRRKYIFSILIFVSVAVSAQNEGSMLHKTMDEQMRKSMGSLRLPNMPNPFYIGLNIVDQNRLCIHSSLGSTIKAYETRNRSAHNMQVLTGNYKNSNLDGGIMTQSLSRPGFPTGNCADEVRRRLWLSFDRAYRMSLGQYSARQSAMQNANQGEWADVPDFLPGAATLVNEPVTELSYDLEKLTVYANAISETMKTYPELTFSWVRLTGIKANVFYSNTEGAKATYPVSIIRLVVNAETLSTEGENLELYNTYHVLKENELPPLDQVISETRELVGTLFEMRDAPVFNDVYNGPILFEGPAASEVVRKTMFYAKHENLYAKRERMTTIAQSGSAGTKISTEIRIDTRIAPEALNVTAYPKKKQYNGTPLIGSFSVDMEGTIPPDELPIIENGVLKNLLNSRIPTLKMKESNGHLRVPTFSGMPMIAPGVIEVGYKNAVTGEELKKQLVERAKEDGLSYAIIVREMTSNLSELRRVFLIDVNTGKETMVRSAGFNTLELNDLRKIIGASNQKRVLNTTVGEDTNHRIDYLSGCPGTFITPDAFLIKDLEVSKSTKTSMTKPPVVKNPLEL